MFKNLPITARQIQATEARLERIYEAALLGLKGDSLALEAGLTPNEYRVLLASDPLVEMAEQKGRADSEAQMAQIVRNAALNGDHKMALEVLRYQHSWVAKQAVSVEVNQTISITAALEAAEQRIIDLADDQIQPARRANADDQTLVLEDQRQPVSVRSVSVPVGSERDAT